MEAQLFRNLTPEQVADVLRVWEAEEKEVLTTGKPPSRSTIRASFGVTGKVDLVPGVNSRKKSTLQRGFRRIATKQWNYDGNPLVFAVMCRRTWAPADVVRQRLAVVVTLAHENPDVRLHAHIRAQLRLQQRAQVRV